MEITEISFWEKYWEKMILPQRVNFNFKNDRVIANTILKFLPKAKEEQSALEIGCAPGKWMVLLYEKLGYHIDGFEYVKVAAEKTRENFLLCDIPETKFNVIHSDFLVEEPVPKYDVVMSLGFIEHFDNYQEIFHKHLQYTQKDGFVIVGFPNFRGINYYIQKLIDILTGSKIIENHNINMMSRKKILDMLDNFDVEVIYQDYIGGFEAALFNTQDIKNSFLRFIIKAFVKFLSLCFRSTKNKYITSYFIFIVKK